MKSLKLKQLRSFFTFDLPVKYSYIDSRFRKTHEGQRDIYASWPAAATRSRLINEYWSNALWHYLLLVVVAAVAIWFCVSTPIVVTADQCKTDILSDLTAFTEKLYWMRIYSKIFIR
ncbi:hypothetical protein ECE50_004020 [Chitinophaga sp. Mgbs1]|uniref:Uncharacterized protein n=1 Tax=Chitinophaga solisilvae TaxID=1233460 RepID=A0A9Q5GS29_9BACT|nr:hypothetical protein [Chitinophaga solisilvae]